MKVSGKELATPPAPPTCELAFPVLADEGARQTVTCQVFPPAFGLDFAFVALTPVCQDETDPLQLETYKAELAMYYALIGAYCYWWQFSTSTDVELRNVFPGRPDRTKRPQRETYAQWVKGLRLFIEELADAGISETELAFKGRHAVQSMGNGWLFTAIPAAKTTAEAAPNDTTT